MNTDRNAPCLLGLDVGTTAVKAGLFTPAGELLGSASREYDLEKPGPDLVEMEAEVYWTAACDCIAECLRLSGGSPQHVAAMAITGQAETLVLVDETGRPLRKAIVWLDNRAQEEARLLSGRFDPEEIHRVTGQHEILACWPACKILWLSRHEPSVFSRTRKFLMIEDYLAWRFTGRYATDGALNPSTLYFDLQEKRWFAPMLEALGIGAGQLPELLSSGSVIGPVLDGRGGLTASTQVVAAPLDQICGSLGAGCTRDGMVSETTGCALAVCAVQATAVPDPQRRFGYYLHAAPGHFASLPWAPVAGMLLRNFRDELGGGRTYRELDAEATGVPAGSEGLLLLPHCAGTVTPHPQPNARGAVYGITLAHTRAHFTRAIMESVAYLLREQVELVSETGLRCHEIRSLGGGAVSRLWLQIKADVLQRPVLTTASPEPTALGAAMLAAVGAGMYRDVHEAADEMVRLKDRIEPAPGNRECYEAAYRGYLELHACLSPLFGKTPHV